MRRRQFLQAAAAMGMSSVTSCALNQPAGQLDSAEFRDDFGGNQLSDQWDAYRGQPKSTPLVQWDPALVAVRDSRLVLSGSAAGRGERPYLAGGVSLWRQARTYGTWQVRLKSHPSRYFSYHILLWPQDEKWPPEIDFVESFDGSRQRTDGFVHFRNARGEQQKQGASVAVDATVDHVYTVEWRPDSLRFLVDGREWATTTGAAVPHTPMWLAMQVEVLPGAPAPHPGLVEPVVEVDWVRIYG